MYRMRKWNITQCALRNAFISIHFFIRIVVASPILTQIYSGLDQKLVDEHHYVYELCM